MRRFTGLILKLTLISYLKSLVVKRLVGLDSDSELADMCSSAPATGLLVCWLKALAPPTRPRCRSEARVARPGRSGAEGERRSVKRLTRISRVQMRRG